MSLIPSSSSNAFHHQQSHTHKKETTKTKSNKQEEEMSDLDGIKHQRDDEEHDNDDGLHHVVLPIITTRAANDDDDNNNKALWLVIENAPPSVTTATDTNYGDKQQQQQQQYGALLSSPDQRDKFLQKYASKSNHGYTVKRISTLNEIRDSLLQLLPPTSPPPPSSSPLSSAAASDYDYPKGLDEIKRFEMFREVIEHEDDLLNQRVSWIILAQSFLMAAFITSAGSVAEADANDRNRSFLYITAAVGLATVIVTMPALFAAGQNIEIQQRVYFLGLKSDEQCRRLHGHDRDQYKSPDELLLRTTTGHIFPSTAFRGWFGIPILKTVVALAIVQIAGWCCLLASLAVER
jgi:hypothetical protein